VSQNAAAEKTHACQGRAQQALLLVVEYSLPETGRLEFGGR